MAGIMARQQRKDGLPLIRYPAAENRGHRALAVEVDHQHPVAVERRRHRELGAGRGLADAALEIGDGSDLGRQPLWPVGAVFLGLGAFRGKMGAQAQNLVEGEPLGAALGFRQALRQIGIGLQNPAEMRGRHRDQVAGDLPGREQPQLLVPVLFEAAAGKVIAPARAGIGDAGEIPGAGGGIEIGKGGVGVDVEIGGQVGAGLRCHGNAARCAVFWTEYHKRQYVETFTAQTLIFLAFREGFTGWMARGGRGLAKKSG